MEKRTVTSAQYIALDGNNVSVKAVIDGVTMQVPMNNSNTDYQAVLDWVAEGNSIADAS